MRAVLMSATLAAALLFGQAAMADTFLPGSSPSVSYAANVDGSYSVSSTGLDLFGATGWANVYAYPGVNPLFGIQTGINSAGQYADAGIVAYFDGSLTLGRLQSVNINLAGSDPSNTTPTVNLWLDTGGDNKFFAFNGTTLTGLNGDAYFGANTSGNVNGSTTFSYLGGPGGYASYTLSQLQQGARAGIDANTKVALWVGITNPNITTGYNYANISSVDVATVPLPSAAWGGLALLSSLGVAAVIRRSRRA